MQIGYEKADILRLLDSLRDPDEVPTTP